MTGSMHRHSERSPGAASGARPGGAPPRHSPAMRLLAAALVAGALAVSAGCGKKGDPEPPPGSQYPRTYPAPSR